MTDYRIGIDWGGTRIKYGAVTPNGEFVRQGIWDVPQEDDIEVIVEGVRKRIEELIDVVGEKPKGIGLGLTGPVDPDFGVMYLPGKIRGLEKYPIVSRFAEHFQLPVTADNDGNVALFAERHFGKAKGLDWASVVTIGTGVGSGVIVGGKILRDPNFLFGNQLGHFVIKSGDEPLCLTGARGTAEMHCSATALSLAVCSGLRRGIPSTLTERFLDEPQSIDFRVVIEEGVERSDALCCDELRRWTNNLGWLLVNVVHAYSSQIVVLSGGATLAADHFLPHLSEHVNRHVFRVPSDREIPIVVSDIQVHAGVLGAAVMSRLRHP